MRVYIRYCTISIWLKYLYNWLKFEPTTFSGIWETVTLFRSLIPYVYCSQEIQKQTNTMRWVFMPWISHFIWKRQEIEKSLFPSKLWENGVSSTLLVYWSLVHVLILGRMLFNYPQEISGEWWGVRVITPQITRPAEYDVNLFVLPCLSRLGK